MDRGEVQRPLFQDLQITVLPEEPVGSKSKESVDEGERTEAPATWKLNNEAFIHDQSVSCVAAACSRKARYNRRPAKHGHKNADAYEG